MRRAMLALALFAPAAVPAAPDPATPAPVEIRLSEAEKQRILEEAAERNRGRPTPAPAGESRPARPIQGEVEVSLGTGGYRSAYGTAYVPIGKDGLAVISLDSTDGSRSRRFGPR